MRDEQEMIHYMNLWHDSFEKIREGTKTIEMRLYDEKRSAVSAGDTIVFRDTGDGRCLECRVLSLHRYPSFDELYAHHDKVSLGYAENETADPADMLMYYSEAEIRRYGTVGIEIRAPRDDAPKQGADPNRQCRTHDPDGVKIERMQISEESPRMKFIRNL